MLLKYRATSTFCSFVFVPAKIWGRGIVDLIKDSVYLLFLKNGEKIEKEKWFGSVPAVALVRRPRPPPTTPWFCSASLLLLAFLLQRTLRNADFIPSPLSTRTNSKQLGRYHSAVFCATPERNGQDAASIGVAFSTAADPSASSNTNRTAYSASRLQTPLRPPDGRAT